MDSLYKINGFRNIAIIGGDNGWRTGVVGDIEPSKEMLNTFLIPEDEPPLNETQNELCGDELRSLVTKLGQENNSNGTAGGTFVFGQKLGSRGCMLKNDGKPSELAEIQATFKEGHLQMLEKIRALGKIPPKLDASMLPKINQTQQ